MEKSLQEMTIHELLDRYAMIIDAMKDYEFADKRFGFKYTDLRQKEKDILAEADRRDTLIAY